MFTSNNKSLVAFSCTVVYFAVILHQTKAQYPRKCTTSSAIRERECCPVGKDGSKCGEMSERGYCELVTPLAANLSINETLLYLLDERYLWPSAFYNRVCLCSGNYDGVDCSKCKFGFEGEKCDVKSELLVRRNLTTMSRDEIQTFVQTLDESKNTTSEEFVILANSYDRILNGEAPAFKNISVYDLFVWMHYYVSRDNLVFTDPERFLSNTNDKNQTEIVKELLKESAPLAMNPNVDYAHEAPAFLPWHRYFLLKWEAEIRELVTEDPTFAIPYWDWRDRESCDVCNDVMLGAGNPNNETLLSEGSPFSLWQITCSHGSDYLFDGQQCLGEAEGPLLRNPGNHDPATINGLPTSTEVSDLLTLGERYDVPSYDISVNMSYRNLLEGFADTKTGIYDPTTSYMHNAVHLFMNGTMSSVDSSANDPIFVVHHAFVDSLYEMWLQETKSGLFPNVLANNEVEPPIGHRSQDYMVPFIPLVQNREGFVRSRQLGYTYDYINATQRFEDQNIAGSGDFENIDNLRAEAIIFNAGLTGQLQNNNAVSSKGLGTDKNQVGIRGKITRSRKFKSRLLGEGGFSIDTNKNILAFVGETGLLVGTNTAVGSSDTAARTSQTFWEKIKSTYISLNMYLQNLPRSDKILLVFLCILIMCLAMTYICGRQPKRNSIKIRKQGRGCCCCRKYDEAETVALLETKEDVLIKGKAHSSYI